MEVTSGTHSYAVRANYKLLVENSVDAYHAPIVHKRYFDWLVDANAMDRMEIALLRDEDEADRFTPRGSR